jgi:hypothetical protein
MDSPDPELEFQARIVNTIRIYEGRPVRIPPSVTEVNWNDESNTLRRDLEQLTVTAKALAASIDAAHIRTYRDEEGYGTYWVVTGQDGRNVVLTDDSEDYVIWLEGPWPFVATFSSPAGVRTETNPSLNNLVARIVTWFTEV